MKTKYYLIFGLVIVGIIQGIVFALIPPPPVNQDMGMYDTLISNYTENMCRKCHTQGVNDYHHIIDPQNYSCKNCHPLNGSQITIIRNCTTCHNNTYNNMTIRRPHHETIFAQEKHCSSCHGNIVDDYDDGHYIPQYDISFTTPNSKYKIISSTNKKLGGCEACHEQNESLNIYPANKTHHMLGNLSGFNSPNSSNCNICHEYNGTSGFESVRYCEKCHSIKALHNIQHDFANTSGLAGYGHTGNETDCNGCHFSWVTASIKPSIDVIIPTLDNISSSKVYENISVPLTIIGDNFLHLNNITVVIVRNTTNNIILNPNSLTDSQINVTIPSLIRGRYGIYVLKNGNIKSNGRPMISVPKVIINTAKKSSYTVTIKGSGFGYYDPEYKNWTNVTIKSVDRRGNIISRSIQINSWSDTYISLTSSDTVFGDNATVNSIFGVNFTKVTK